MKYQTRIEIAKKTGFQNKRKMAQNKCNMNVIQPISESDTT